MDGSTWDIIDPLIKQGKLPIFKKLKENSSWSRLQTFEPTKSAIIWTSIATGKNMIKHGIVDWSFINQHGIKVPYSSSKKRAPSIWEILNENGKQSVVLGWFVTDPPDKINGLMVSDSFAPCLSRYFSRKKGSWNFSNTVQPQTEFKGLLRHFNQIHRDGSLEYSRLVREMAIPDYSRQYQERYGKSADTVPVLKVWESFLFYNRVEDILVDYFLDRNEYDLFLAYYRFPDVFFHFGTLFLEKEYHDRLDALIDKQEPSAECLNEFNSKMADISLPLLRDKEAMLEKIYKKALKENSYLIVVSDHGFRLTSKGYCHYDMPAGIEPPDGILMLLGPDIKRNTRIRASVYDIAPTILYLTGLPVGGDMDGRPLQEAFISKRPFRTKIYTKMKHCPEKDNRQQDMEKMEELKALGYIK